LRCPEVERSGRGVAILAELEVIEEPPDVRKKEVADLRFFVERRIDLGKRILQLPMLLGKGKRGTDLFEACHVLPLAQKPIRFQGRERKTPGIETCRSAQARNRVQVRS
jgi:hypothetical protein